MDSLPRHEVYVSPLAARYASPEMSYLFSDRWRAVVFRQLWLALAEAQQSLGLPITSQQIAEMRAALEKIDFKAIETYEKRFRHDVMAHIHAFGDQCPAAKPILHLGATSAYVVDNADLIQMREALNLIHAKLLAILKRLAMLAEKYAAAPCLSYTHFQPAQPTTIGKRFCLWLQDFLFDAREWHRLSSSLPFLGAKGATGTQSSFLFLFQGDSQKVCELEKRIAATFSFPSILPISGQTYTRKLDLFVLNALASFGASSHKFATDLRLLAHEKEFSEPFETEQVGSSAMPYKQNPIYSERICGLSRFVISLSQNSAYTTGTQWLERSLDDSSNRRLTIPESFLAVDAILNLFHHILSSAHIDTAHAAAQVALHLPQLCMENILMAAVKKGGNRQLLHETLRRLAFQKPSLTWKTFIEKIAADPAFHLSLQELEKIGAVENLTGRAAEQARAFVEEEVIPSLSSPDKEPSFPPVER